MNDEQKENIFNVIKDLETISDVKRTLRVNDVRGAYADEMVARWESKPIPEPIYPAKKLVMENKAIESAPVVKEVEPILVSEPEPELAPEPISEEILETVEEVVEEPVDDTTVKAVTSSYTPSKFTR